MTDDARIRLSQAAGDVTDSSRAMDEKRPVEAAQKAREAARRLASLARQVGALQASDLPEQLARERDFAQEIARSRTRLGGSPRTAGGRGKPTSESGNRSQRGSASWPKTPPRWRTCSNRSSRPPRSKTASSPRRSPQAESINPPREVEQAMGQNAEAIGSVKSEQAARDAGAAAERLEALAHDLESARRAAAGPKLERLMAAEKEAAALQERLRTVSQSFATGATGAGVSKIWPAGSIGLARRRGLAAGGRKHVECHSRGPWRLVARWQGPRMAKRAISFRPGVYTQTLAAAVAAFRRRFRRWYSKTPWSSATDPSLPSTRTWSTITTACFLRT